MNMIEKVAAAIQEASNKFRKENGPAADYAKRAYEAEARAAIEAMCEPSEEMILNSDPPDMPAGGSVEDIWSDMIDAALKE